MKLKAWVKSSQDPEKVATTIRGIIMAGSSFIIFFGSNFFGINLVEADIIDMASYVGMFAGGILGMYGLLMKVVMKVGKD